MPPIDMGYRGAYVARVDLAQLHLAGVAAKVSAQADALRNLPADVDVYHLRGGDVVRNGVTVKSFGPGAIARRLVHYVAFHVAIARYTAPLDFLYVRYQGSSPLLIWALKSLRKKNPGMFVAVEVPTWPFVSETMTIRGGLLALVDAISRRFLKMHVDRVVTFSQQREIFGIPAITTANGVDVASLPLLPGRPASSTLRLLGLANLSPRHGYDRVIAGLRRYYATGGCRDVRFDVIGTGAELPRLQQLVEAEGLQGQVTFHGPLRGAALDEAMVTADIGVSCLAMHRAGIDSSDLKSREFCARGLPFVLGYHDVDFPPGIPFAFQAPANEDPLDIAAVIAFHDSLAGSMQRVRQSMRAYAEANLTWECKMEPVLRALQSHLADRRLACR
jgi:glycosyltransferase involved in cell wall biosynthesis